MKTYNKILEEFKEFYLGYAVLAIIAQSCLGSIAAMCILKNGNDLIQMIQLSIIVLICMFFNGSILAQLKPKIVFNLFIISILLSLLMIVINIFIQ